MVCCLSKISAYHKLSMNALWFIVVCTVENVFSVRASIFAMPPDTVDCNVLI
jgi:hypothetical protein